MEDAVAPIVAVFVVIFAGFIVLMIYAARAERERMERVRAWAERNGLSLSEEYEYGIDERYSDFEEFRQGENRYAKHVLAGGYRGRRLHAFDYHYETRSRDSNGKEKTESHLFSALLLTSAVWLKPLAIRPEGFFDKVAQFMGFDDINFESAEFSRNFHVSAPDRKWAYDVLHARAIGFLLARPALSIRFAGNQALIYSGGCFDAPDFANAAETLAGLLDSLPAYVKDQQAAERGFAQDGSH